ncbi:hypothetical protein BV898_00268 [Hypsibius exemplaris]|uniref:Uncharacterized protein n=1 Tax=Hypsibius exemplaris TaxID=2072580 RepID=A0A1W0XF94_HYPEX|nr:hypothetical protein BV898_00268 [Hypsibius exemplaris]
MSRIDHSVGGEALRFCQHGILERGRLYRLKLSVPCGSYVITETLDRGGEIMLFKQGRFPEADKLVEDRALCNGSTDDFASVDIYSIELISLVFKKYSIAGYLALIIITLSSASLSSCDHTLYLTCKKDRIARGVPCVRTS